MRPGHIWNESLELELGEPMGFDDYKLKVRCPITCVKAEPWFGQLATD